MKANRFKILTIVLTIPFAFAPLVAAASFKDTQSSWANNAIETLSEQGIITGYPDGTFHPNGVITRAEFSTVLVKALGLNLNTNRVQSFNDVPMTHWAYPSIETIRSTGLVSGYPNGLFLPDRSISRAEAMTILASAARIPMPSDTQIKQTLKAYPDTQSIPHWARIGIAALLQSGLYSTDPTAGGSIHPLQPATRADIVAWLQNLRTRENVTENPKNKLPAQIVIIPISTHFSGIVIDSPLSSEMNKTDDVINLKLDQPLLGADNRIVIPADSKIIGKVIQVEPAEKMGQEAFLEFHFTELVTPDNRHYSIDASVATEDQKVPHIIKGDRVTSTDVESETQKAVIFTPGEKLELKLNQPLSIPVSQQ